ncbi:Uncharacterised protein [Vibrio cholerae]|nr:Uncharacterised protein [Vibrio cholerae]
MASKNCPVCWPRCWAIRSGKAKHATKGSHAESTEESENAVSSLCAKDWARWISSFCLG